MTTANDIGQGLESLSRRLGATVSVGTKMPRNQGDSGAFFGGK